MNLAMYDMEMISSTFWKQKRRYDYFIIAPNIESRSRAFFREAKGQIGFNNVIIADYSNFHINLNENQENSFFDDFDGFKTIIINAMTEKEVLKEIKNVKFFKTDKVGIDITGFSIPSIYSILFLLKNVCRLTYVDVFYSEPQFYVYEEGYFDSYHNKIRERRCAPIIEYYNAGMDEQEILTILLGFDGGLADLVYNKLGEEGNVKKTLVVNGFPSYTAKLKDVSLFNNEGLIDKLEKDNLFSAAANNPFDVYNLLCKIKKQNPDILLNLCSIGSKPMALGACLFALDNMRSVKVTYPFYEKKNFDVNEKTGKIWRYGITFND